MLDIWLTHDGSLLNIFPSTKCEVLACKSSCMQRKEENSKYSGLTLFFLYKCHAIWIKYCYYINLFSTIWFKNSKSNKQTKNKLCKRKKERKWYIQEFRSVDLQQGCALNSHEIPIHNRSLKSKRLGQK